MTKQDEEHKSSLDSRKESEGKNSSHGWENLSEILETPAEEIEEEERRAEEERRRYQEAKRRSEYYRRRYEQEDDSESTQWSKKDRKADPWELFVPEFLKRSRLFGADEEKEDSSDREDYHYSHKTWFGEAFFSKYFTEEMSALPKEIAKEVASLIFSQADRAKNEILKLIAAEVRLFLQQLDLQEELRKTFDGMTVDVDMKIRFSIDEKTGDWHLKIKNDEQVHSPQIDEEASKSDS